MTNPNDTMLQAAAKNVAASSSAELVQKLAIERSMLNERLSTIPSFLRGLQAGIFAVAALTGVLPDIPMAPWLEITIRVVFLLGALHCVVAQRGLMYAKGMSRA